MKYTKDNSNWPLVVFKISGRADNEILFNNFLADWSEMYVKSSTTKEKFRLLIDVTELEHVEFKYVIGIGQFLKKCKCLTELWMEKTSILVNDGTIKNILEFIFTIYKPVRPFKVFSKIQNSVEWVLNNESGDEGKYN